MSEYSAKKILIFKVFCLFQFFTPLVMSQVSKNNNPCNITWTIYNDTNFRNAYRASVQPTHEGCLEECEAISGCSAVDIDFRNSSDSFFTCWFHSNHSDSSKFSYPGVNAYVKYVDCSKTNNSRGVQGPLGDTGPTGSSGSDGPTGFPGMMGMPGAWGIPGLKGSTGQTGMPGGPGVQGYFGSVGPPGSPGFTGATGLSGRPGATGPPAAWYSTGLSTGYWSTGYNVYVNDACQPSWRLNVDRQAPGALSSPVATTTVDRCKDVCLSFPNCIAIEFSSSSLSCGIHNSTNSLLSYVSTGTDLHVLLDRCTIVGISSSPGQFIGLPGFTGYFGSYGSTGSMGETGNTGATGFTGSTGLRGPWGMNGQEGVRGGDGSTGFTGPTGDQGPPGPAAVAGATKVKTPSGEIYVKDSCQSQWVSLSGYESPGAAPETTVPSLDQCKAQCLAASACIAIDYRLKMFSCHLHNNVSNLSTKSQNADNLQYVLISKCPPVLNTTSPITAPLTRDGDEKEHGDAKDDNNYDNNYDSDESDCVQPEEDIWSKSEFYTVVITPPLTILVNVFCYFLYLAGKKILKL